jgi:hypothetical protein
MKGGAGAPLGPAGRRDVANPGKADKYRHGRTWSDHPRLCRDQHRGMRVTVGMVVGQIGSGRSIDSLLADYPCLEREDILQAVRYAAWPAEGREFELTTA